MRDVEVQPPKPSSQSSSEPPTFHPGQIPSTHEPIQIYQPWSFSRHFRYLVKNGLVTAGTSSLLPPRPGVYRQPASHWVTPPYTWNMLPLFKSSSNILELGKMLLQPRGPWGECAQSWWPIRAGKWLPHPIPLHQNRASPGPAAPSTRLLLSAAMKFRQT